MELDRNILSHLIEYWRRQKIQIISKSLEDISSIEIKNNICLPQDFKLYYSKVNGMTEYFPNEIDENGFLFYPVEEVVSVDNAVKNHKFGVDSKIYLFAEYMHRSWWYGYKLREDNTYVIGIIPGRTKFKEITSSLFDFIQLYLEDSVVLYDHS